MELNSFLITFKLLKNLSSPIPNTLISEKSYQNLNIREKCFVWLHLLFYFLISSMFPSCTIRLLLTDFTRVYGRPTYILRIYKMRGSGTERTTRCLKHLYYLTLIIIIRENIMDFLNYVNVFRLFIRFAVCQQQLQQLLL